VQSLAKPLDQLLEIVFHVSDFTKGIFLLHVSHKKVMMEIEERQRPRLVFQGDDGVLKKTVTRKKKTVQKKSIYDFV
jgi:ATP-dependent exoDNAse (exonuclease V) alpha subunit